MVMKIRYTRQFFLLMEKFFYLQVTMIKLQDYGMQIKRLTYQDQILNMVQFGNQQFLQMDTYGLLHRNKMEQLCFGKYTVAFSPNGNILASGGDDKLIFLYDVVSLEDIGSLNGHEGQIRDLVFSSTMNLLASEGQDEITRIQDIQEKKNDQKIIRSYRLHLFTFISSKQKYLGIWKLR
ncbi:unnamed protein product [Paramecium sonneborni]|uniref:Uncharacterized protein n=1 Tax=Paramecium sonneborni TaxID=65129 RepID=A0A8S1RUQ1_9CILI|nr:unnamed protein product [Paramecium sonneborni]